MLRLASWNLRFDSKPDSVTVAETLRNIKLSLEQQSFPTKFKEQPWSIRRVKVAQQILAQGVVLVGIQEALVRQINDLIELLGSDDWDYIGVGRDDGNISGEFGPIFYKKSALKLLSSDNFWLSNTPFEPSKYPGAGSFRMCTVAHFQFASGNSVFKFTHLNTHLDDQSDDQRRMGASLILARARYEAVNTGKPTIVTGDFNSAAAGANSGAYKIITGAIPPVHINDAFARKYAVPDSEQANFSMVDLRGVTPPFNVLGNFATYTGFTSPNNTAEWCRIDFVFGGVNGNWSSQQYEVANCLTDDGVLASDHRPVYATISMK